MTLTKLRVLFAVLEQQRVTKDSVENLGRPSQKRLDAIVASREKRELTETRREAAKEAARMPPPTKENNDAAG